MPCLSTLALTATPATGRPRRATTSFALSKSKAQHEHREETIAATVDGNGDDAAPNSESPHRIGRAAYSDLNAAAALMTDGFHPEVRNNPLLRPIRRLVELERLQGNFPYEEGDRHFYLVVRGEKGGELIGFCDVDGRIPAPGFSLSPFKPNVVRPRPYLSDLVVNPDWRRRGVASALMAEAERLARDMGYDELYLGVRSTNEPALKMYSNMGYEEIVPGGDILAFLEMQKGVRMLRRSLVDVFR